MDDGHKSGLFYPNRFINLALKSYASIIGGNGLSSVLNMAGLSSLIENPLPDDLDRQFDFSDLSAIQASLEDVFGVRGAKGISLRAGEASVSLGLDHTGGLSAVRQPEFQSLPWQTRLLVGLSSTALLMSQMSNQVTYLSQSPEVFLWVIKQCPFCWERRNLEKPACSYLTGQLQALTAWFTGGHEFRIHESKCVAMGDDVCEFTIFKLPIS